MNEGRFLRNEGPPSVGREIHYGGPTKPNPRKATVFVSSRESPGPGRNDDRGGFRRPGQDRFEGRPEKATPGDDDADDGCRGDRVPLHRLFPQALRQGVETFALKLRPVLDCRALRPGDWSCLCVQRGPGPWSPVPTSSAVLA